MVTGEGELYHVKNKQKRKNHVRYLADSRKPEKKQKGAQVFHKERFAPPFSFLLGTLLKTRRSEISWNPLLN